MKELDEKFIQLYGKKPSYSTTVTTDTTIARSKYEKSKSVFALGYKCGFDAAMELQAQEDDYQDEKLMEDVLGRGG